MEKIKYKLTVDFLQKKYSFLSNFKSIGLNTTEKREKKIIVSLTSIPSRFDKLYLGIETMMHQTMKPDKIILYLGNNVKSMKLPLKLEKLKNRGLEIIYCDDAHLKPHTKYFYTMQKYIDDIVITLDDDILYNKNVIKKLYESYIKYPKCVSCIRAHKITFDENNRIKSYNDWDMEYAKDDSMIPNHYLCATGVGGVLYPPHVFKEDTFNQKNIKELSLNADDLWLKAIEITNDIKVVKAIKNNFCLYVMDDTQAIALSDLNVHGNRNDECMNKLINYFNITRDIFDK